MVKEQPQSLSSSRDVSCPCCVFLPDDLFLPKGLSSTEMKPSSATTTHVKKDHDTRDNLQSLLDSTPLSTEETLNVLVQHAEEQGESSVILMDTHGHAHLEGESSPVYQLLSADSTSTTTHPDIHFISLSCAVHESDWTTCLDYAAHSPYRLAAVGIHPWYMSEYAHSLSTIDTLMQRMETILQDHPGVMIGEIGLCKMARWTRQFPQGKAAALTIQRDLVVRQLQLAARYQRPVSIHCVQQQGVLLEILQELSSNDGDGDNADEKDKGDQETPPTTASSTPHHLLPPAMALHSFSGTAHQVQQLLEWEGRVRGIPLSDGDPRGRRKAKRTKPKKSKKQQLDEPHRLEEDASAKNSEDAPATPNPPPLLYFGFSHSINYAMSTSDKARRQGVQAIRAVPRDRLLIESDIHATDNLAGGTLAATSYIAWALEEPAQEEEDLATTDSSNITTRRAQQEESIRRVATQCHENARRFFGHLHPPIP